jgi:hypothetical protein
MNDFASPGARSSYLPVLEEPRWICPQSRLMCLCERGALARAREPTCKRTLLITVIIMPTLHTVLTPNVDSIRRVQVYY